MPLPEHGGGRLLLRERNQTFVNVPQAGVKETDSDKGDVHRTRKDGRRYRGTARRPRYPESKLRGCRVNGHGDHRIVMALTIAGLNAEGETCIETAEAVDVTFPEFPMLIRQCGGDIRLVREERR